MDKFYVWQLSVENIVGNAPNLEKCHVNVKAYVWDLHHCRNLDLFFDIKSINK